MNHFIHLLGSSLILWMIVRINGGEEQKHDLQVRLGEAMLRLGGEVRLGIAMPRQTRKFRKLGLGLRQTNLLNF